MRYAVYKSLARSYYVYDMQNCKDTLYSTVIIYLNNDDVYEMKDAYYAIGCDETLVFSSDSLEDVRTFIKNEVFLTKL